MEIRFTRLLATALASAALLGVAAWLPLAHGGGVFVPGRPATPRAERPAWPLWAHGTQLHDGAPADSAPPEGALSAPRHGERISFGEDAAVGDAAHSATYPSLHEQPLWLGVATLSGIAVAIPTPPPRSA
ncbi:MAG TPA: hypothetical protein VFD32_02775 [Dehalococcoidia bacterium]|nr:hypothetical protein [Dehalococcoidia bacterium]